MSEITARSRGHFDYSNVLSTHMFAVSSCPVSATGCPGKLQQRLNSSTRSDTGFTRGNALRPKRLRWNYLSDTPECDVRKQWPCSSVGFAQSTSVACTPVTCSESCSDHSSETATAGVPTKNQLASPYVLRACLLALVCAVMAWAGLAMASHASSTAASTSSSNILSRALLCDHTPS